MKRVKEFLHKHWDQKRPLLLGFSGGPDSKALLYGLLDAGCKNLHVAHVDHGWREESAHEAALLKREVEGLGLPFYTTRLETVPATNREDVSRKERLLFFRSLFEKIPFQALLLGHHADDLAETILKRVFEGAHLPFLGGMQPVGSLNEMIVWRPLLGAQKKELMAFIEEKGLKPFFDPTNQDIAYLRSRLRVEMLPFLEKSFGKNIMGNLCLLSERAAELRRYLDGRVAGAEVIRGDEIEVSLEGLERIEQRHLLQKVGAEIHLTFTRSVLEQVLDFCDSKHKKKVFVSPFWIVSGRGKVVFLRP